MDRMCDACGETYVAKRVTSRFCSSNCRVRFSRGGGGDVVQLPTTEPEQAVASLGVLAATERELVAAERLETALGQACLTLARRLDSPGLDTGSAMASVAARLDDLLAKATKGAGKATRPGQLQDELAARREKHGA